ncbi:hypothetical protein BDZ89DRAFT_1044240 [Hymenopellis radicata]|nr:hypothetical protein BDZ89DRAFT_1044240 [Hymenopellis radicata]
MLSTGYLATTWTIGLALSYIQENADALVDNTNYNGKQNGGLAIINTLPQQHQHHTSEHIVVLGVMLAIVLSVVLVIVDIAVGRCRGCRRGSWLWSLSLLWLLAALVFAVAQRARVRGGAAYSCSRWRGVLVFAVARCTRVRGVLVFAVRARVRGVLVIVVASCGARVHGGSACSCSWWRGVLVFAVRARVHHCRGFLRCSCSRRLGVLVFVVVVVLRSVRGSSAFVVGAGPRPVLVLGGAGA